MNVPKRIFWTTIGTAAIAVATFVTLLFWFSGKADDIAADELHQRVATAIENAIKHNAVLTIDYAHWDSAFFWLQAGVADDLYTNLGSGAGDSVSFDLIYLLSPNGTAQYAYVSDNHESDLDNFEPRIANALLAELTKLDFATTDVVSSLIEVDGDIVIATAGRILPDDLSGLSADTIPIMIGGLWLDIPALKDALMIKSLAIMPDLATLEPGQSAYVLKDINGVSIAQLVWERPTPGQILLHQVAPAVVLAIVLLMLGSGVVARISTRQMEDFLHEQASARSDPITGLLNRTGIAEIADSDEIRIAIAAERTAVLFVDLNGLKVLNDTYGHRVGDEAIRVTAQRLRAAVRDGDRIARIGGDEFVCLVTDDDPRMAAVQIANRLRDLTRREITLAGRTFHAHAAIGIAIAKKDANWEMLLNQADDAMYQAKRANTDQPVFFDVRTLAAS